MFKFIFFKHVTKTLYIAVLIAFLVYLVWRPFAAKNSSPIDPTITYTTVTETFTTPLNFTPSPEEVVDSISQYVSVPKDGLDWKLLAKTKSIPYSFTDEEGQERHGAKPEFPLELQRLDGQIVTMQGYMFPLGASEKQSMFLFGPFPVSSPYHYHVGPALVIETHMVQGVELQWKPITISGRLELVSRDDNYNVFYRLQEARPIK